ncbi:MAG: UDP-2,3-diacylglucosamine diphosphatase [Limnobacter sp.]|nr:UDP-2,3-diacylglucosamine diphosphatase [Limnobacter sp.]
MLELSEYQRAYFASDLHLSADTPHTLEQFESWLASISDEAAYIFLLGDLFEAWIGDDHLDSVAKRVRSAIQASGDAGSKVYFMQGNRDFLLGEHFCLLAGMELLPDPEFLRVGKHIILLTHGDQLCTDDKAYQQFRQLSRQESWIDNFLKKPIQERQAYAAKAREESTKHKKGASQSIMDVNLKTCEQAFLGKWPDGCFLGRSDVVLHGHTHRCAVHGDNLPGLVTESYTGKLQNQQRIVLPDWDFDSENRSNYRGGFLTLHGTGHLEMTLFN